MRIVFMGTPDFAVETLKEIIASKHECIGVYTQPDRRSGRGKKVHFSPVKEIAVEAGIPVYQPRKIKESEHVEELKGLNPDLIVVVAYGQILSQEILDIPKFGCINVHASLLPKYRGAAPIHWAIIDGEKETGVTTMQMDIGLDTGDMLLKGKIDITENMTMGELHDELAAIGGKLLIDTLDKLEDGSLEPEKQEDSQSNYAPMLGKDDEKIDWNKTSEEIHNKIRGMNPWPGVHSYLNGKRIKFNSSQIVDIESAGENVGEIVEINSDGLVVQCKKGSILIKKLQPEGKKSMHARDFANGYKISENEIFGGEKNE